MDCTTGYGHEEATASTVAAPGIAKQPEHGVKETANMNSEKIKCWVTYCDEYPGGMVWEQRSDALDYTRECREENFPAYARVKYFTQEQLDEMREAD